MPSFAVPRGGLMAIVGPSGCGKSTALDLLACSLRPEITIGTEARFSMRPHPDTDVDVLGCWRRGGLDRLAGLRLASLGYILQTGGLLPFLSVRENIVLRCKCLGSLDARREAIPALVERLGIGHLLKKKPDTLSVGERQRVAIASALAHGPPIVLADEPTASLDPLNARTILAIFTEIAKEQGITIIMVTHAPDLAERAGFTLVRVPQPSDEDGSVTSTVTTES
jgi:putative ABC transport system ATP-binding protein